ncbi:phytanoyl-CoA dioxygenase family protein [Acaryochloris marina]|uniref:Phytanoyl-CoA dioxygenase n=1 Tax=Acaryochloris marina (strain MBIC 11017) TaxID=329726 RepID=B0C9E6_ACAM1|nr:hypothetical protein [Acaryochloris marina]ABW28959.1 hypothetical protein AM1_3974 [Acaryochloris marina MBIC11017]BDM77931.1 hypothetical protein AM10699_08010 [Acaryochloris marina MBIC10699]
MRKLARIECIRQVWGTLIARTTRPKTLDESAPLPTSLVTPPDPKTISAVLRQQGIYVRLQLSNVVMAELVDFAHQPPFAADRNPNIRCLFKDRATLEASLGYSFQLGSVSTQRCAAVQTLIYDPGLVAISTEYLGAKPTAIGSELLWSFPGKSTWKQQIKGAQVFHYDIDDYRSLKFFFYLTDVDESNGPHVCIQKTHWGKKLVHQFMGQRCASLQDQTLVETYRAEQVLTVCGQAGLGIAEDTFCFHKGNRPVSRPRLMLQIQYALNDYGNIRAYI